MIVYTACSILQGTNIMFWFPKIVCLFWWTKKWRRHNVFGNGFCFTKNILEVQRFHNRTNFKIGQKCLSPKLSFRLPVQHCRYIQRLVPVWSKCERAKENPAAKNGVRTGFLTSFIWPHINKRRRVSIDTSIGIPRHVIPFKVGSANVIGPLKHLKKSAWRIESFFEIFDPPLPPKQIVTHLSLISHFQLDPPYSSKQFC